jgi:hypothetical protein
MPDLTTPTPQRTRHPSAPASRTSRPAFASRIHIEDSSEEEAGSEDGSSSNTITSHCSHISVYMLVSKFSEYKKEIVRQIGFGGILDLPCISKVNMKFSSRLMSKLDTEESCIVISESRRIYIHEKDLVLY